MGERIATAGLKVDRKLHDFIEKEALPGTGVDPAAFWEGFGAIVAELGPRNRELLAVRDAFQEKIDAWHKANRGSISMEAYQAFLRDIGYIVPQGPAFSVTTSNVDPEIAETAGPQLVVPVMNARYALNAANARWGSLYDALYGTDALGDLPSGGGYDPARGARVIAWARNFLDESAPLNGAKWADVTGLAVKDGRLEIRTAHGHAELADPSQFAGHAIHKPETLSVLLVKNGLHTEIRVDRSSGIGKDDPAGISDVILESALTAIMDCEDSIAAVDAEDKVLVYSNWLGLMKGDLTEEVAKGGKTFTRRLNPDPEFTGADGKTLRLKGRSLMLVRNVGHLMTNPAILCADGSEIPEGIMDAMVTSLIALHDVGLERAARQQPGGIGLHRQAEDARTGRGRFRQRAVRQGRRGSRHGARHVEDGHHGRGTAHDRQPQGMHSRRQIARRLHQHRLPRPHRRRDPYLDGSRPDDPQGRHEGVHLDRRLRELERRHGP